MALCDRSIGVPNFYITQSPDLRLTKELDAKLSSFQTKFDELLVMQANAIQLDSEPSQQESQTFCENFGNFIHRFPS